MNHLDLDALADALAGEAAPRDRDHLAGCAHCAHRLEELELAQQEVSRTLAGVPAPRLPEALAGGIAAALRAEGCAGDFAAWAGSEEAGGPAGPVPPDPVEPPGTGPPAEPGGAAETAPGGAVTLLPELPAERPRRWLPLAAAAAAAVVLLGGIGGLAAGWFRSGPSSAGTSTSASRPTNPLAALRRSSTGIDYRRDGTALRRELPLLLSGAAPLAAGAAGTGAAAGPEAAAAPGERAPAGRSLAPALGSAGPADPLARLRQPAPLASCLFALLPPQDPRVLALDYAAFEGQPALVVVLPSPEPQHVDVYVVGATCSQQDDALLFFTRVKEA